MKRVFLTVLAMAVLSGCAAVRSLRGEQVGKRPLPVLSAPASEQAGDADGVERVPFRIGVSSATVENLAKLSNCRGSQGAGLMTPPGPVEVYRLICDDGSVFMAKCELRQCKRMPAPARAPAAPVAAAAAQ